MSETPVYLPEKFVSNGEPSVKLGSKQLATACGSSNVSLAQELDCEFHN